MQGAMSSRKAISMTLTWWADGVGVLVNLVIDTPTVKVCPERERERERLMM